MIDGEPCKVVETASSKPGKHGSSKMRIVAVSLVSGNKKNMMGASGMDIEVPIMQKKEAQVVAIMEDRVQLMDLETYETYELEIPEELKGKIPPGGTVEVEEAPNYKVISKVKSQ